jgi:hypothetical protein
LQLAHQLFRDLFLKQNIVYHNLLRFRWPSDSAFPRVKHRINKVRIVWCADVK